jgi:hypothetical protein
MEMRGRLPLQQVNSTIACLSATFVLPYPTYAACQRLMPINELGEILGCCRVR